MTGEFRISLQDQNDDLEAVIDRLEVEVLQDLLGKELYDLFIADLDGGDIPEAPQTQRFIDIYNAIYEDETIIIRSEGMLAMLRIFIWFEWTKQTGMQNTPVGMIKNEFENGTNLSNVNAGIESTYNRAIKSYRAIVDYIIINSTTYPEYGSKGIIRQYISWL